MDATVSHFAYWGKARSDQDQRFHLLPLHALDADARCHFDCEQGEGSLAEVVAFVKE